MFIHLKARKDRTLSADEWIAYMTPQAQPDHGHSRVHDRIRPPSTSAGGPQRASTSSCSRAPISRRSTSTPTSCSSSRSAVKGLTDVTSDLQIHSPQVQVDIDRDHAASLGVTREQIEDALYNAYGARQVSTIYTPNNQYWVILELSRVPARPEALSLLYLHSSDRRARSAGGRSRGLRRTVGPLTVEPLGQLPAVTISFNLAPGVSLGDGVTAAIPNARPDRCRPAITYDIPGHGRRRSRLRSRDCSSCSSLAVSSSTSCWACSTRTSSTRSRSSPAFPSPVRGVDHAALFRMELNIYGFVGIIMLIGIVKKNAIMMIDFALDARASAGQIGARGDPRGVRRAFPSHHDDHHGRADGHAAHRDAGGRRRRIERAGTRPRGRRRPDRLAILTLYITPVFYLYLERSSKRLAARNAARAARHAAGTMPAPSGSAA